MSMKYAILALTLLCLALIHYANKNYTYAGELDNIPSLTASAIADPRSFGKTFKVKGRIVSVFRTKQGIIIMKMFVEPEDMYIEAPVFPSLGSLTFEPKVGLLVEIIGNLSQYKQKPQIRPLAAELIKVLDSPDKPEAVSLSNAIGLVGHTLVVGPVSVISAKPFLSKKGKRHLRLTVIQDGTITNGIMFDGTWSEQTLNNLRSNKKVLLIAEISRYKGQPSLIVKRVIPQ